MFYALKAFSVELEGTVIYRCRYKNQALYAMSSMMVRSIDLGSDGFSLNPSATTQGQD